VLQEGQVGAGDPIEHIHRPPNSLSVADIDALLYLPDRSTEDLTRAVAIEALSEGWRQSLRELLQQATAAGGAGTAPVGWVGFRPGAVVDISSETADVRSVTIGAADGHSPMPSFLPGQYLTIRIPSGPNGALSVRNYSLSSSPGDPSYRISVKREEFGEASGWLHAALSAGQVLDIAAPRGDFVLYGGEGPVLFISAGIGVTPLLAMLHALAGQSQNRAVTWIQVLRSPAQRPFAHEVRSLLAKLPQSRAHIFYTADAAAQSTAGDVDEVIHRGRPDVAALRAMMLPPGVDAYLCGPGGFMKAMSETLVACGIEHSRIHSEAFGPSAAPSGDGRTPHVPDGPEGTGPNVTFSRSGITTAFAGRYANLLELAEACDIPVHWSCRTGVCHSCITAAITGDVNYQPEPLDAPSDGEVLLCCAIPATDLVLDI
jgi:ferredoxin-NADP reductase